MKDIPLFTTEYGIASLTLKEIPYTQKAYIRIQDTAHPEKFIEECLAFCRAVGAEEIYGTGHSCLGIFPTHCKILRMRGCIEDTADTGAALFPVTEDTIEEFCKIYNKAMRDVPNAAYMSVAGGRELLAKGSGYFVHSNGKLLGIGIAQGNKIDAVASVVQGSGKTILLTLAHALIDAAVELEVAEENIPAMKLYKKLGFVPVEEVSAWHKIF